jgi:hypothetical protein
LETHERLMKELLGSYLAFRAPGSFCVHFAPVKPVAVAGLKGGSASRRGPPGQRRTGELALLGTAAHRDSREFAGERPGYRLLEDARPR